MKALSDYTQCIGLGSGWNRLRLRLGGGVVGSVLVAAPDSVHSTFFELQLGLRLRLRLRLRGGGSQLSYTHTGSQA